MISGCTGASAKCFSLTKPSITPKKDYARGDVHTNTAESSFALLKRGIHGIYHNVSRQYLQRYIWQADFLWNNRQLNDGERITTAIRSAEGKRVRYLPAE